MMGPIRDEDMPRPSSYSSTSSASAISELSFEGSCNIDRSYQGSFALDHELSERDLTQAEESRSDTNDGLKVGSSALESPPSQVMERTPDTPGYRSPSHVFERNTSNLLNHEWSTCSNESLFSITGNMSFMRDQYSWKFKSGEFSMYIPDMDESGELGYQEDLGEVSDSHKSGELTPPSPPKIVDTRVSEESPAKSPQVCKSGELVTPGHVKNSSSNPQVLEASKASGVTKTPSHASDLSVPTKKEGSKRKDQKGGKPSVEKLWYSSSVSHHSDGSAQSFAFPLLGEADKEKSVKPGRNGGDRAKESSATSAPKRATSLSSSSWSSCFSCCS